MKQSFSKIMNNALNEDKWYDEYEEWANGEKKKMGIDDKNMARRYAQDTADMNDALRYEYQNAVNQISEECQDEIDQINDEIADLDQTASDIALSANDYASQQEIRRIQSNMRRLEFDKNKILNAYQKKLMLINRTLPLESRRVIKNDIARNISDFVDTGYKRVPMPQMQYTNRMNAPVRAISDMHAKRLSSSNSITLSPQHYRLTEELSDMEQRLVFGTMLEDISEVIRIEEEADPERERRLNLKQAGDLAAKAINADGITKANLNATANQLKHNAAVLAAKVNDERNARAEEKAAGVPGSLKEGYTDSPTIVNAEKRLAAMKERNDKAEDRQRQNIQRLKDQAKRQEVANQENEATEQTVLNVTESEDVVCDDKSKIFCGLDGKLLKAIIYGTTSSLVNSEKNILEILMSMPNVNYYVKMIKRYLNQPHIEYKEYIDLKVYRDKFKRAYCAAKEEYDNRLK